MASDNTHQPFIERVIAIALEAEAEGNLPVGALITLEDKIIAEGPSQLLKPHYWPGGHAEIVAMRRVPATLWAQAREMTLYSTLEPCLMCISSALLHGIGQVVYAATDPEGGGGYLLNNLPSFYDERAIPRLVGPLSEEKARPLYERLRTAFVELPCAN